MNVKIFVIIVMIVIPSLLNIPGIPIPVRMTFYGLLITASTVSSATAYYYFSSFPETQNSLLVSSSKSVIVWHSVFASSTSTYLSYSALYFNEDEKNWIVAENDTCLLNPSLYAQPIFATALAQFQIFRFTFKLFPQQYLSFNHEAWAYPFAFSVPVAACALQILVYLYKGSICDQLPLNYFLIKLNIPPDSASYASKIQVTALMFLTTGIIETLIQLEKQFNTLQTWIRKKNSHVHPAPTPINVQTSSDEERMVCNNGSNLVTLNPNNLAIDTAPSSSTPSSLPTNENSANPSNHIRYYAEKLTIFVIVNFFVFFLLYNYFWLWKCYSIYSNCILGFFLLCFANCICLKFKQNSKVH